MRLIAVTSRSSLGARFDHLLTSRFALQSKKNRVSAPGKLPHRLEQCVNRLVPACEWRAYRSAHGIFFAIARTSKSGERPEADAGLEVYFLDADASVYSAVRWEHDATHGWWLDSVLELTYDCKYGWWLDALTMPQGQLDTRSAAIPVKLLGFGVAGVG